MASATLDASVRDQSPSAPEERGISGLKFLSGVADTVVGADRCAPVEMVEEIRECLTRS
jgi:hypothetical protein